MNTLLNRTGLPASCVWPSDHSISNHLIAPLIALPRYPSASEASDLRRSGLRHFVAGSPDNPAESSSLSLWTDRSFPVASHPLSPRRSYFPIQAGERLPEEDFHLSDQPHSQAHYDGNIFPVESFPDWNRLHHIITHLRGTSKGLPNTHSSTFLREHVVRSKYLKKSLALHT